jgi:hypothetical protein
VFDLPVGGVGKSGEYIAQISMRVNATTAATFDDGVEDGAALTGFGRAYKKPVFLFMRSFA